jgi:hypothetical protein
MNADRIDIVKLDAAKQLVFGIFYLNKVGDELIQDLQGDVWATDEMEASAYDFVLNARVQGENHIRKGVGRVVESVVLTYEKQESIRKCLEALGIEGEINLGCEAWFGGFKVNDAAVWAEIEKGNLPMFSIGGSGERHPVAGEE